MSTSRLPRTASEAMIEVLGREIGERNLRTPETHQALLRAATWICERLEASGWIAKREPYYVADHRVENLAFERRGRAQGRPLLVLGAHYDTVHGSTGANDNGSGVACLLRVGQLLAAHDPHCSVRLVAFTNEEPPHTRKPSMGSFVYARACAARREQLLGMISLETLCTATSGWARRMPLLVAGNIRSRRLARAVAKSLQPRMSHRILPLVMPGFTLGIRSSDHWSFWQHGYPAVMLTAGGPLSYPHYHRSSDRIENVSSDRLEELSSAVAQMVSELSLGRAAGRPSGKAPRLMAAP